MAQVSPQIPLFWTHEQNDSVEAPVVSTASDVSTGASVVSPSDVVGSVVSTSASVVSGSIVVASVVSTSASVVSESVVVASVVSGSVVISISVVSSSSSQYITSGGSVTGFTGVPEPQQSIF